MKKEPIHFRFRSQVSSDAGDGYIDITSSMNEEEIKGAIHSLKHSLWNIALKSTDKALMDECDELESWLDRAKYA